MSLDTPQAWPEIPSTDSQLITTSGLFKISDVLESERENIFILQNSSVDKESIRTAKKSSHFTASMPQMTRLFPKDVDDKTPNNWWCFLHSHSFGWAGQQCGTAFLSKNPVCLITLVILLSCKASSVYAIIWRSLVQRNCVCNAHQHRAAGVDSFIGWICH